MKAQISIEVLLLLVVLIAVVALVANQMMGSAKHLSSAVEQRTDKVLNMTENEGICKSADEECIHDDECCSGVCLYGRCT